MKYLFLMSSYMKHVNSERYLGQADDCQGGGGEDDEEREEEAEHEEEEVVADVRRLPPVGGTTGSVIEHCN